MTDIPCLMFVTNFRYGICHYGKCSVMQKRIIQGFKKIFNKITLTICWNQPKFWIPLKILVLAFTKYTTSWGEEGSTPSVSRGSSDVWNGLFSMNCKVNRFEKVQSRWRSTAKIIWNTTLSACSIKNFFKRCLLHPNFPAWKKHFKNNWIWFQPSVVWRSKV